MKMSEVWCGLNYDVRHCSIFKSHLKMIWLKYCENWNRNWYCAYWNLKCHDLFVQSFILKHNCLINQHRQDTCLNTVFYWYIYTCPRPRSSSVALAGCADSITYYTPCVSRTQCSNIYNQPGIRTNGSDTLKHI